LGARDVANTNELAAALASGATPIRMASGTYTGNFISMYPAHLQPQTGAQPVIDGSITIKGAGSIVEGLEIHSTAWLTRQSAYPDDAPPDITVKDGITVAAGGCMVRGCSVHDCRQGIFAGSDAPGLLIEGCNLYNNGWLSTIRGSGHGLYLQNNDLSKPKVVRGNVIGPQYGWGLHIYGSAGSHLRGFDLSGNVHLWHGLIGGNSAVAGATVVGDLFFGGLQVGYGMIQNDDVILSSCHIAARATYALNAYHWTDALIEGNTIATDANFLIDQAGVDVSAWQANAYYHDSAYTEPFGMTFAQWQQSGRDVTGSYTRGLSPDSVTVGELIGGRRIVTIVNTSDQVSVLAPLSGRYTNALNPAESVVLKIGDPLLMSGWTVATPYAASAPLVAWDSRFAVFMVH
jgi:hypothetical protein